MFNFLNPGLSLSINGAASTIVRDTFDKYKGILFKHGDMFNFLNPTLSLSRNGVASAIVRDAFDRYKGILFKHGDRFSFLRTLRPAYDVSQMNIIVLSDIEEVQFDTMDLSGNEIVKLENVP
ncbi:beta-hexosaminidase 1 [Cajanus cajan]|uniref:beta-hexosaminidase 1 n=1 Tax=Cajanus cajan TaxID=3821 RepID=UPI00098DCAEE|nr:beta-hexosaminidase 1 [Cajanus cajan]